MHGSSLVDLIFMALYIEAKSFLGIHYWDDFVVYGILPE
jgi:hypothetical protein